MQGHPAFGALFETLVVTECWKQIQQQALVPTMYHYRQHSGTEVDLVIEKDGMLFPVEIKASAVVDTPDARAMRVLAEHIGETVKPGLIIYGGNEVRRVDERTIAVPFDLL